MARKTARTTRRRRTRRKKAKTFYGCPPSAVCLAAPGADDTPENRTRCGDGCRDLQTQDPITAEDRRAELEVLVLE